MRKKVKILIVVGIIAAFGTMGVIIVTKLQTKKEAEAKTANLPDFKFYRFDETPFTRNDVEKGKPVLVMHFHPECENCQFEAEDMRKNPHFLDGVQVLMVTAADREKVTKFAEIFNLDSIPQITFLFDKEFTFFKTFGENVYPVEFIYNKEHKLVKKFKGEVKMELVSKLVKQ